MIVKIVVILISLLSISIKAQSFPYLNASTGNFGEFPVDKDTNVYIFPGDSRLIKADKNLNPIWSKGNGSYTVSHLLLSKTGSLFFIGGLTLDQKILVGKIDKNGDFVWIRNLYSMFTFSSSPGFTVKGQSLLLDRNNELVISGNVQTSTLQAGFFLKLDTNGIMNKLRIIDGPLTSNFSVAYDSMGYYKFLGGGWVSSAQPNRLALTTYNDLSDQIENTQLIYAKNGSGVISWTYMRSKFNNSFYVHLSYVSNSIGGFDVGLLKCNMSGIQKWNLLMGGFDGIPNYFGFSKSAVESASGDIFFEHDGSNYTSKYKCGVFKIDSSGITNGIGIKMIDDHPQTPTVPYHHPQTITKDRHYFDVKMGSIWQSYPIELNTFNTSFSSSCAISVTCAVSLNTPTMVTGIVTHSLQSLTPISSFSTNFTMTQFNHPIIPSNCTFIGIQENQSSFSNIHPNPASTQLSIENVQYENLFVMDVFGKIVLEQNYYSPKISVQQLPMGLYFLKLRSGNTIYISKFIKE
jgi:hypothetical protein